MSLPMPPTGRSTPGYFNGYHSWSQSGEVYTDRRVSLIHIALFLATLVTTTMFGALQEGANPFTNPSSLIRGLPFSATLMSILLFHEMGHYLLARVHGVRATLPYFIPGLPYFIGTFGAFIRMQSLPADRRVLFDIGAAGPWAGMLIAVPAVIVGLSLSEVRPLNAFEGGYLLGDSFLFSALTRLVLGVSANDVTIELHPVAFAGWFGLFVTFLNLLPVGQLDGGHVVYSLFGPFHRWISRVFLLIILFLGFQGWMGWFFWVVLLSFLGIDHPPTRDLFSSLDPRRKVYAWCTVGLFVLTFMPVPISLSEPPAIPSGERIPVAYHPNQPMTARPFVFLYRP